MLEEPFYITVIKIVLGSIVTGISFKIIRIIFSYDAQHLF